eukprot:gene3203-3776_t
MPRPPSDGEFTEFVHAPWASLYRTRRDLRLRVDRRRRPLPTAGDASTWTAALGGTRVDPVTNRPASPATWDLYAREMGHRLVRARQVRGLSQARVAHAAGISTYTYQKYEKGESRPGTPANPRL